MSNLPSITNQHPLLKPSILEEVKADLFKVVQAAIATCYAHLNFPVPSKDDANYLVNQVTDIIEANYPTLRLHEIPTAFANGIRKKYGEFYGLSVVSFEQFITGYLNSPERTELVKEKIKLVDVKPEPTADEKFTTGKELCLDQFEKYKSTKLLGISALAVYEYLNSHELIHKDYKIGIYQEALQATIANKKSEITLSQDLHRRRLLNGELEMFEQNVANDALTQDQHNEVLRTGRKIILKNWFNDLIINEENLEEVIENKRP